METLYRIIQKSFGFPMLLLWLLLGGLAYFSVPSSPLQNTGMPAAAAVPDSSGLNATIPEEQPQAAETFDGRARLERGTARNQTSWDHRPSGTSGAGKYPRPQPRSPAAAMIPETPQLRCRWQCFRRYALQCNIPSYLRKFLADHHIVRAGPDPLCA